MELSTGDRILLKDQDPATENGIYTVNASGAPTRATDFDDAADVSSGAFTFISGTNANKGFVLTTTGTITPGSTALTFSQFSAAASVSNDSVNGDKLTDNITIADSLTVTNNIIMGVDIKTMGSSPLNNSTQGSGANNGSEMQISKTNIYITGTDTATKYVHVDGSNKPGLGTLFNIFLTIQEIMVN